MVLALSGSFAVHQQRLKEQLNILLARIPDAALRASVMEALRAEGKLFSQPHVNADNTSFVSPAGEWALLVLLIAQSISPDIDPVWASSVAVAVECLVCAIDLLDDLIDNDQTPTVKALGEGYTLTVAEALQILGQQAIIALSQQGMSAEHVLLLCKTLNDGALAVDVGQHRDLLAEQRPAEDFTREECIDIAAAKSGSLMSLACILGAQCASASAEVCQLFSEFGEMLGIAHQLDNDSHDLYDILKGDFSSESIKTDVIRGKKTLPVVLAAVDENTLQKPSSSADEKEKEHLRALHEGITTTWGISLLYRERARDRLQKIETHHSVDPALLLLLQL